MIREQLVKVIANLAPTPIAWIAIVVGVSVHIAGFFLFKVEVPTLNMVSNADAYVSYVSIEGDSVNNQLRDRALLADSVPLFLPSVHDYSWHLFQPGYYVEDRNASLFAPIEYSFHPDIDDLIDNPFLSVEPPKVEDLLSPSLWNVYEGLGERAASGVSLNKRFGVFQFVDESTGTALKEIQILSAPTESDEDNQFLQPCEVLVYVGPAGCLGVPRLTESSGIVAIDKWMIRWVQDYCNKLRVKPGYYRVVFGP